METISCNKLNEYCGHFVPMYFVLVYILRLNDKDKKVIYLLSNALIFFLFLRSLVCPSALLTSAITMEILYILRLRCFSPYAGGSLSRK